MGNRVKLRRVLAAALVALAAWGWHGAARGQEESGGDTVQGQEERLRGELTEEQWQEREAEKAKLRAMLWASAVILSLLFTGLVLMTILRSGRRLRRRIFKEKSGPTDASDLWSQYRLDENEK